MVVIIAALAAFLAYLVIRYTPIISRIFEEKPLFFPLRVAPTSGEEVRFSTSDGLELVGTYASTPAESRVGVLVFCHEYLSDRWSFQPYIAPLLDLGFDIFSFDFRNHGASACASEYRPLQWVSDHEVRDLRAALAYLRSRPDRDPAGFGLFGVSRGGGTALVVAAEDPGVWGVVTDGAFPTRGTMNAYIRRWAEIYVSTGFFRVLPTWVYIFVGWAARIRSEKRLSCRYPGIERAVSRLAPRPWLMIHGAKDTYIGPAIARSLFARAGDPKEFWLVPLAKHNRCRQVQPEAYAERIKQFFGRYAPRRALLEAQSSSPGPPALADLPHLGAARTPEAPVAAEVAMTVSN
ncbi:MAG TPA: alpha/beta fold hydrolase [Urbifossiella sp.]|nr:alpha/beta fold hydrolase [Urbifossiella sp.]